MLPSMLYMVDDTIVTDDELEIKIKQLEIIFLFLNAA